MLRHGRDEANLTFEAWDFKCLGGHMATCLKNIPVNTPHRDTESIMGDDFAPAVSE